MRIALRTAVALAACLLVARAASAQNIVSNGSFETPDIGGTYATYGTNSMLGAWKVASGSVDLINSYWQPAAGGQSLDMSGGQNGLIEQVLNTIAGTTYELTFAIAGNPDGPPTIKTLNVLWDNVGVFSATFDKTGHTRANMGWVYYTTHITATAATHKLGFQSAAGTAYGPALDDVRLVAVPEASSVALLLTGLAPLGLALRRRVRKV